MLLGNQWQRQRQRFFIDVYYSSKKLSLVPWFYCLRLRWQVLHVFSLVSIWFHLISILISDLGFLSAKCIFNVIENYGSVWQMFSHCYAIFREECIVSGFLFISIFLKSGFVGGNFWLNPNNLVSFQWDSNGRRRNSNSNSSSSIF